MAFTFQRLDNIPEVFLIQPRSFRDQRGFFLETYKKSEFSCNGVRQVFVQDNYSHSVRRVLRGMHYQKHPKAQAKLVTVLTGDIFDVAIDIRTGSPTHGRWVGTTLSGKECQMLYVPAGFAHGFCVLSDEADVLYKATEEYAPELERGIIWNDLEIGIQWPIRDPILSPKDARLPPFKTADHNFRYEGTNL